MAPELNEIVREVLLIVGALFPIVSPLSNAPIFLSLTRDVSSGSRSLLARKIATSSFILLLGSIFVGTYILAFFGISLPVVQVGGGLVVFATGWTLLNRSSDEGVPRSQITAEEASQRAFYPLTLPLTVGPGAISVAITVGANRTQGHVPSPVAMAAALVGSAVIALTVYLSYRFAERIAVALGETAMNVVLRLSSFILVCIGVQIVWNGASALLRTGLIR